jgi:hypothetical protein
MLDTARLRLLIGLLLLAAGSFTLAHLLPARADNPPGPPPAKELRVGLEPEDVIRALHGPPGRVSRQIFSHRALEQWHYGAPLHLRIVFDCLQGQKPTVREFRKVPPPVP